MAARWIDKITGSFEDKRSYLAYRARVKALPAGYREAALALERYLMNLGPSNNGKALTGMLADLADLFELSVAQETPIRALVGEDPSEFAEAFLDNYAGGSWIRAERKRLAESIDHAAGLAD